MENKQINQLVEAGNISLLVLRKESSGSSIGLFNAVMGITQVEGSLLSEEDASTMSVIEKNFFNNKQAEPNFAKLFHNGGI